MRSNLEELQRQRTRLMSLAAIGSKHGQDGTLRVELMAVKQKLSAVTVDTPNEEVNEILQLESALSLRLSRGEAELQRVENEIGYEQQLDHQARMRADRERQEIQKRRDGILSQIATIDDQLAGRKLIRGNPSLRGSDIQDDVRRQQEELKRLRARIMEENGLTEADIPQPAPAANPTQLRPDGRGWT